MAAFRNSLALVLTLAVTNVALARPGDVVQSFAAPTPWPAGLASDGTHLYVADWRNAKIHEFAPPYEKTVRTFAAPTLRPHGLAFADGRLYVADNRSGEILVLDPQTGVVENRFEAPGNRPAGLALHDGVLYIAEGRRERIYKVIPEDGTILGYFAAPTGRCTCLTHDGTYLWTVDRLEDELYMIDVERETVVAIVDTPGPHPAGIVWHGDALWNVDFETRQVYRLVVDDPPYYTLSDTRTARVEFVSSLFNYGPADVVDMQLALALPPALPQQELQSELEWSESPTEIAVDRWGQSCALFDIARVPAGTRREIAYAVDARISAIRYFIRPERAGTLADIPADVHSQYTVDGARYRIESEYIRKTAEKIVGDETNCYWIARKVFDYVIGRLKYEMVGGWDVPEVVLKRRSGSCSEYTFAFIALCRAAGLPARYQGSVVVRGDDASIDEAHHRWAQVYLPNYGWVPVDANAGDKHEPADQCRGFGELPNRFLITTQGGGDSEYLGWSYNSERHYKTTGHAHIVSDSLGFWAPRADELTTQKAHRQGSGGSRPPERCMP